MEQVEQQSSKWDFKKLRRMLGHGVFALAVGLFLFQVVVNVMGGKFTEVDGVRLMAIIWIGIAWHWWFLYNKLLEAAQRLFMANMELEAETIEASLTIKVLSEVLDKIDKRVLARQGILVTSEKRGRTVN